MKTLRLLGQAMRETLALFWFDPLGMLGVVCAQLLFERAEAQERLRRIDARRTAQASADIQR